MIGRKCLVTGASQGLGYAISHKLALLGASVTLVARNEEKLIRNIETLPTLDDLGHHYVKYDLNKLLFDASESDSTNTDYQKLLVSLSELHVLINCAGEATYSLLPKLTPSHIHSTVNLNLISPILLSQLAYKSMLRKAAQNKAQKPAIVNILSVLSLTNKELAGTSVYAALKAGLLGFTKSLAHELRDKVRVNAVLPGLITETAMGAHVNPDLGLHLVALEDVTSTVVNTVMDERINGECIIIDELGERKLKTF